MNAQLSLSELQNLSYVMIQGNVIMDLSDAFIELVEYPENMMLNKDISEICKSLLRLTSDIRNLEERQQLESFLFTRSLKAIEVSVSLRKYYDKKIIVFERKESRGVTQQLQIVKELCNYQASGVAIFTVNTNIILLEANQIYLDILDSPFNQRENTIGKRVDEYITGWRGSTSEKVWEDIITTGEGFRSDEYRYDRFERGITYWKTMFMPIHEGERIKYVIQIIEDITENVLNRKQVEQQTLIIKRQNAELQNALALKDEFFTTISHEFKTPLNVINAAVQAIEQLCAEELSDTSKRFMSKIKQNTFRQLRLVNNILDFTRLNARKLKLSKKNLDIVFMTRSIIQSVELYAEQKGVQINFNTMLKKKVIAMDEEKYERILLNLLSNAIKFTPKGRAIHVSVFEKESQLCIEVKDEGIGIPKDKHSVVFERFGQVQSDLSRQGEGTGIGLSLVKLLVNEMGGIILLTSQEGKGSVFSILFPINKTEEQDKYDAIMNTDDQRLTQAVQIEFCDVYL